MYLLDIETYPNYFLLGFENYVTKEKQCFEITNNHSQLSEIVQFLSFNKTSICTFNGTDYDLIVLGFIVKESQELFQLSPQEQALAISNFSKSLITSHQNDSFYIVSAPYKYVFSKQFIHIDLYRYWAKLLRVSKKISLKGLAVQLNYPEIQELPFHPETFLEGNQIQIIKEYNLKNDLGILRCLFDAKKDEVILRKEIYQNFKIECFSKDAIKIASDYLLHEYCKITGKDTKAVSKLRWTPTSFKIKDVIPEFQFKTPFFQDLYSKIKESDSTYSSEFIFKTSGDYIKISLGIGGIHSILKNKEYFSDEFFIIKTSDIASLYPNNIINNKFIRFIEVLGVYGNLKTLRILAKKNKEKLKDLFYKLILNGTSGLLDQEHSWLYYTEGAIGLRMTGQLQLLRTLEELTINNFEVLSLNTDGVECKIEKSREKEYEDLMLNLEKEFNLNWEHDTYEWIRFSNINNYIAKTVSGKFKRKGLYKLDFDEQGNREIPLGDSVNFLIIPKIINKHLDTKIPVKELVTNWKKYGFHIYDFCASMKADKSFEIFWNNKKQQQLNRFYASRQGAYLYKKKNNKLHHMLADSGVIIFNKYEDKEDYNINYNFYIKSIMEILNGFIENRNTLF